MEHDIRQQFQKYLFSISEFNFKVQPLMMPLTRRESATDLHAFQQQVFPFHHQ